MRISKEKLLKEAEEAGFRAEVLEKAINLLALLEGLRSHPVLKENLALKGGTALNLFLFQLPRLSVDIDLNYIGAVEREAMLAERPRLEEAIQNVCLRQGFAVRRMPQEHAGGKWSLRYISCLGQNASLELDVNFMFRIPLWPVMRTDSHQVGSYRAIQIQVLDIHELAAGKLAALLARKQARDLFDAHQLLYYGRLHRETLRSAFVVYGAMNRKDWRKVSPQDVDFETDEIERQLLPLLRLDFRHDEQRPGDYGKRLVEECRNALEVVLPFSKPEKEFLDRLLDHGEIEPSLVTRDQDLQERIKRHPLLKWKALNVKKLVNSRADQ